MNATLKFAQSFMKKSISEFDNIPLLLNLDNGTLDLSSMKFREHKSDDFITQISPAKYDPQARSERFEQFVNEILEGNSDKIKFVQKIIGCVLAGDNSRERFYIFHGRTTRNGKTTFFEAVNSMLGNDYACILQPESLSVQALRSGNGPSEDIARLKGTRLVYVPEPKKTMVLDASRIKQFTGGGKVTARKLRENSFEFKPQFTMFFDANHLPQVDDDTLFKSERTIVIEFNRHFEVYERDVTLKEQFKKPENLSGILNWCIAGWKAVYDEGLTTPEAVSENTGAYAAESDILQQFFNEYLEKDPNSEVKSKQLYIKYKFWCNDAGFIPLNMNDFNSEFTSKFNVSKRRKRPTGKETDNKFEFYLGVRLVS